METAQKNVLLRITEMYDKIFQAEKKVADFILKNPELAVNANVSELANYSGVSDATVIRLCKHLGYQGYYQMKICLSRDIGRRYPAAGIQEKRDTSVGSMFRKMGDGIKVIGDTVNDRVFQDSIQLIRKSTMVHLVAAGNTSPLCMYCGYRMERMGIRCSYNMQPEYYMNHINLAQPTDIVLAISWSGTSRSVVHAMELAKEKNMQTIAVNGYKSSPMAKVSDYLLISAPEGCGYNKFSSHSRLSEMAVVEGILLALENELPSEMDEETEAEMLLSETKY